jgi:RNA polymerase sigma-32 factor
MAYFDDSTSQGAHRAFVQHAMKAPLLTREREQELAIRWSEQNDTSAIQELVTAYTRLVVSMAAQFRRYGLPASDLIQEGTIGLMQAAQRFEHGRDVRFSTYASWWIRSAMQEFVLRNWSIVRTGTTAAQKKLFFNIRRLRAAIEGSNGSGFGDAERAKIAEELQVPLKEVGYMEQRLAVGDRSLDAPRSTDGEADWNDSLADMRPNPEEVVIGLRDGETRSRWLREALTELSPRDQKIIMARRLSEDAASLEEIGRELGISKERVRQLEMRAMMKLQKSVRRLANVPNLDENRLALS